MTYMYEPDDQQPEEAKGNSYPEIPGISPYTDH